MLLTVERSSFLSSIATQTNFPAVCKSFKSMRLLVLYLCVDLLVCFDCGWMCVNYVRDWLALLFVCLFVCLLDGLRMQYCVSFYDFSDFVLLLN